MYMEQIRSQMWRICRKTIFPRFHSNRQQNNVEKKNENTCSRAPVLFQVNKSKNHSNQNNEKKQHADKKNKHCWDDPQFHICFFRSSFLETAGWLGAAAALCLNPHLKLITNIFENDRSRSCIFSRNVLAMPRHPSCNENTLKSFPSSSSSLIPSQEDNSEKDKVSSDASVLGSIRNLANQYTAAIDNSIGIASLDKNNRKAFRQFQAAARLGSSQAFYNLGLCYELGKGTRINLSRAAFCYRRAAIKGHGLAAFNLAVYFMKGIGGLPVDADVAKLLLAEAAKKGVPEAQLYLGIELLEKEKWLDAVAMFNTLAKENIPEGQYYLGMCYENGWGVEKNEKLALELFKKSADQGNEKATAKVKEYCNNDKKNSEPSHFVLAIYQMFKSGSYRNHLSVLQTNKKNSDPKESPFKSSIVLDKSSKDSHLHTSASVPELGSSIKISAQFSTKVSTLLYLDLMIPLLTMQNSSESKPSFFIGDNIVKEDCSSHLLSCSVNVPQIMEVET